MLFLDKPLNEIQESDLLTLIGRTEDISIDFKRQLYSMQKPTSKNDFLSDVSALANSNGGHIIYGMDEAELVATNLCGLGDIDPDDAIQRLVNWANEGLDPRIPGLDFRVVDIQGDAKRAIIAQVPRSFAAPHQIRESRKFHKRYPSGNSAMNVSELRDAFNLSQSYVERIEAFRDYRVSAVESLSDVPILLRDNVTHIWHFIPLGFDDANQTIDVNSVAYPRHRLIWFALREMHFNFEGVLMIDPQSAQPNDIYIQVYRNGIIEVVHSYALEGFTDQSGDSKKGIPLSRLENETLQAVEYALQIYNQLGMPPPISFMQSITRCKDVPLYDERKDGRTRFSRSFEPLKRNIYKFPKLFIEHYEDYKTVLKPHFDVLWNAAGYRRSPSYDEQGNWINPNY